MNASRLHFDALETRDPAVREAALMAALPVQVAVAQQQSRAFAELLHGVSAASITSRAALAQLPVVFLPVSATGVFHALPFSITQSFSVTTASSSNAIVPPYAKYGSSCVVVPVPV